MNRLIFCELERLLKSKLTWYLLVCTPILAYVTGNYIHVFYPSETMSSSLFVIIGLKENLYLPCNIAVAAIVAAVYTEEYRGGQLRLLFLRQYSRGKIFVSKLLVINMTILALLVIMGILLSLVGLIQFQNEGEPTIPLTKSLPFIFQYYILAYLTLAAISCLFSYIALISKNVTYMLGISVGYVLISLLFDGIYLYFANFFENGSFMHELVAFVLIPYMQHTGVHSLMNEHNTHSILPMAAILIFYMVVFIWTAYRRFVRDDYLY